MTELFENEIVVLDAIYWLTEVYGRTGNMSMVASRSKLSRTRTADVTSRLKQRQLIIDIGKGSAYHWRLTSAGHQYRRQLIKAKKEARVS